MVISYGLRIISSCLKNSGNKVEVIFARAVIGKPFSKNIEDQIVKKCRDSDLIGVSLMSNYYPHATSLTKTLKNSLNIPIIWGGVHPTFCPEQSLEYADMVCVGEGEKAIIELVKRIKNKQKNINKTPGIWFKENNRIIKNNTPTLIDNLDSLPMPDFGPESHYIRDKDKIKKLTKRLFLEFLTKRLNKQNKYVAEYYISTSRGCPYRCSYCASNTVKNLYPAQRFFRLRSINKVIEEVKYVTGKFGFIKFIYFSDDDLLASPIKRVQEFCALWKKEINLPFYGAIAPWSYNEEKLKFFLNAGLNIINMGIQSVTKRGGQSYHRVVSKKKIKQIIKSISQLKSPLPPVYDFILDNPYENDKDKLENLRFILNISKPRKLQLFSLIPFPGTEIYNRMKNDGLLNDADTMIYNKSYSYPEANYLNMLIFLSNTNIPTQIIKLLSSNIFIKIFNSNVMKFIYKKVPYTSFLFIVRNFINFRFWQYNASPKGSY